jgi:hypothetical protein
MRSSQPIAWALIAICGLAITLPSLTIADPTPNTTSRLSPDQPRTPGDYPNTPQNAPNNTIDPTRADVMDQIRGLLGSGAAGTPAKEDDGLRPFADVSKGYERVVSSADGQSYFNLWTRSKDGGMLAELPRGWESQRMFIALTVASGETYAGLQAGDMYVYWRRVDNRLVLIEPEVGTKSTGDQESKASVKRLFTDRVVLDVPIVAMGPSGNPVIDMKALLVGRAATFFGGRYNGNAALATIKRAKAFPQNVEIGYELPTAGGRLQTLHYSISQLRENPAYKPRLADERIGYFTTVYRDLGKFSDADKWVRYINRWHLEKREPSLKLSPPKEPIVFYIESTVPVRYRRWIKNGVIEWNKAYEKIGIKDAIECYQQDAETGAHMEKDPEDVRYNFVRWLSNDIGTAIGPSRVNPNTGEILDADVILTDGWIRHFWVNWNQVLPEMAMEGFSPETLAWLETRPQWDPRVRLAAPEERNMIMAQRVQRGVQPYGGHAIAAATMQPQSNMFGLAEFDGLVGRQSQRNGLCMAARGKGFDLSMMRMYLEMADSIDEIAQQAVTDGDEAELKKILDTFRPEVRPIVEKQIREQGGLAALRERMPAEIAQKLDDETKEENKDAKKDEKKEDKKKDAKPYDTLDGIPEWFIGPLLADLTMHEVGHTLGLRHNFKASSIYTLEEINSSKVKGIKSMCGSVMDYTPININMGDGPMQGDYGPTVIGPYDYWAIEYGYTSGDTKEVLKRVAEPELVYATDEDTGGPDPLARRYDFSKNPLDYAKSQMKLAEYHRGRLLDKFVKDGESWAKVRRGYMVTLGMQTRSVNMMSSWVGGAFVNRDRKGDPNARNPIQVVPVEQQRAALKWCIDNSFRDESFGLTPALLEKMTVDKWLDAGGASEGMQEATFPIHDRIMGMQSSTLTMLMNPTTLRRVLDNEYRLAGTADTLTLPELMDTVTGAIFSELDSTPSGEFTPRKPWITSLRRNLQRETIERLIDLTLPGAGSGEAYKPISNLATAKLREIDRKLTKLVGDKADQKGSLDTYTFAHLSEAKVRIAKALDAQYIYNNNSGGGGFPYGLFFGQPTEAPTQR